jgi:phospho-N-acetylmuramoyl-pentapeptide-transferase
MLANFLKEFADIWIIFNLFNYISFKALLAASTALLFSWIIGPRMIAFLQRKQWGEEIRQDGPQTHQAKAGTPTMGGFIILSAVGIPTLLWADLSNMYIQLIFLATLWMGVVGFIDDYLKTVKKKKKGLIAKYKLAGQVLIGAILSIVLMYSDQWNGFYANSTVPFFKNLELNWGFCLFPWLFSS